MRAFAPLSKNDHMHPKPNRPNFKQLNPWAMGLYVLRLPDSFHPAPQAELALFCRVVGLGLVDAKDLRITGLLSILVARALYAFEMTVNGVGSYQVQITHFKIQTPGFRLPQTKSMRRPGYIKGPLGGRHSKEGLREGNIADTESAGWGEVFWYIRLVHGRA